jgi:hypothetical protein
LKGLFMLAPGKSRDLFRERCFFEDAILDHADEEIFHRTDDRDVIE